jgi:hypothetical protein
MGFFDNIQKDAQQFYNNQPGSFQPEQREPRPAPPGRAGRMGAGSATTQRGLGLPSGMGRTMARTGAGAGMLGTAKAGYGVRQAQADNAARAAMMSGGVRPGAAPTMNAVEAARAGAPARPQFDPNDPRNAALAGYR